MADYLVTAKPKKELLDELNKLLKHKSFINLSPFGTALTYSLENARLGNDGTALWEEEDYCSPPLAMEREAVLDKYFDDLKTEKVREDEGWKQIQDLSFLFPQLHEKKK